MLSSSSRNVAQRHSWDLILAGAVRFGEKLGVVHRLVGSWVGVSTHLSKGGVLLSRRRSNVGLSRAAGTLVRVGSRRRYHLE